MTKKDFIALADMIREHNASGYVGRPGFNLFDSQHLNSLAAFCADSNPVFYRERWLGYISGQNGPNGGKK
jgi:hypothetical protein